MAYMSQEKKREIAANLKKVMPQGWKYSLSVRHYSTLVLTITAAPVDLMAAYNKHVAESWERRGDKFTPQTYAQINEYWLGTQFSGELLEIFQRIKAVLNDGNHDRSDIQTDYFDVGWYVDINIGRWDKPFQVIAPKSQPSYDELKARIARLENPKPVICEPEQQVRKFTAQSDLTHAWLCRYKAEC